MRVQGVDKEGSELEGSDDPASVLCLAGVFPRCSLHDEIKVRLL